MYYVYILTNRYNKVLYIGVTNNLERRLFEHRNPATDSFACRYNTDKLVYYEVTDDVKSAIAREKQIKGWTRSKKDALISAMNSDWRDLSEDWK